MKNQTSYLFIITIIFFTLGFFNIIFAWLGFLCILLPFVLLAKNKKKTWCQSYCPRASLYTILFKGRSLTGTSGPNWLIKGGVKWVMLGYFSLNLFVIFMSSFMVFMGKRLPLEKIRFLMVFQFPWDIPQLLNIGLFPDWAVHLSFRMYSMMLTTTILGLLLGLFFMPRTWCTICPINTVSNIALKSHNKEIKLGI